MRLRLSVPRSVSKLQDSIYHKKAGEFRQFIQRVSDKSVTVTDVIGDWREFKNLDKAFKDMTIQQLADNPNLIIELFHTLRKGMLAESKFQLEYDKEQHIQELIETISEDYDIDKARAEGKIITRHENQNNSEDTGREFNYCLEVVLIPYYEPDSNSAGEFKEKDYEE